MKAASLTRCWDNTTATRGLDNYQDPSIIGSMMIDKETKMMTTKEWQEWVAKTWNECQERAWNPDSCEKTTDTEALDKPI